MLQQSIARKAEIYQIPLQLQVFKAGLLLGLVVSS